MRRLARAVFLTAGLIPALAARAGALVQASVAAPPAGVRVTGNAVTVAASVAAADLASTVRVRFQYRAAAGGAWSDLASATGRPNPATSAPFYAHWDTTALSPGDYELRAVAADSGGDDPAPPSVTVTVDPVTHSVDERLVGSAVRRDQTVGSASAAVVDNGDSQRAQLVRLQVPAGSIDLPSTTLTLLSNPAALQAAPAGYAVVGSLEVTTIDGQSCFCAGFSAGLTISYADANGDGVIDGTGALATSAKFYRWEPSSGVWTSDFPSAVDTSGRTVSASIMHTGRYALLVPSDAGRTLGRVYPVPFRSKGFDPDQGRAYTPSDPYSGIVFEDVPESSRIEIYADTGARVKRLEVGSSRRIQWDVKNEQGQDVASGVYLAVISPPGQPSWRRKLLVVR